MANKVTIPTKGTKRKQQMELCKYLGIEEHQRRSEVQRIAHHSEVRYRYGSKDQSSHSGSL